MDEFHSNRSPIETTAIEQCNGEFFFDFSWVSDDAAEGYYEDAKVESSQEVNSQTLLLFSTTNLLDPSFWLIRLASTAIVNETLDHPKYLFWLQKRPIRFVGSKFEKKVIKLFQAVRARIFAQTTRTKGFFPFDTVFAKDHNESLADAVASSASSISRERHDHAHRCCPIAKPAVARINERLHVEAHGPRPWWSHCFSVASRN